MKNKIHYILCLLFLASCMEILDVRDPSAISPDIWNDEQSSTLYINKLYHASLPAAGFGVNASLSDETTGGADHMYGRLTAESEGAFSPNYFLRIREINIAINELEKGKIEPEAKKRIQGQAYFFRAWEYFGLVRLYGGVPIIERPQDPFKEDVNVPRHSASACIEFMISDLDKAIEGLPASWPSNERGRITRGAAAALKGRVLLFWASPQFNPNNDPQRWERAYKANREAKEMLIADGKGLNPNFRNIFIDKVNNPEFIFGRLFDFNANVTHGWENSIRPGGLGSSSGAGSAPTWDLVQAFPMKNGLSIHEAGSGYDESRFWKDRDPRFEATVAYNGAPWTATGFDPNRKQWHYFRYNNNGQIVADDNQNISNTGFYCRKASNSNIPEVQISQSSTDWIEIRFAEVLLNLAECAAETDKLSEAYDELITIRTRAGIEAGTDGLYGLSATMNKSELIDKIMNERQIEFAFENKRYWDLRRRNLFPVKLNGTRRQGLRVILKQEHDPATFRQIRNSIDLDAEFDTYFEIQQVDLDVESEINFPQPLYNFFGIPQSPLDRSPALEQTIGWGGNFDPLKD